MPTPSVLLDSQLDSFAVFGDGSDPLARGLALLEDDRQIVDTLSAFLQPFVLPAKPSLTRLNQLLELIRTDHTIHRVEQLAHSANLSVRSIQRLFAKFLGLTPKQLIRRYRLHQALQDLENGQVDILDVSNRLGYTDQAHLIKDFKAQTGKTPLKYLKDNQG